MIAAAGNGQQKRIMNLRVMHVLRAPFGGLFRHVLDLVRGQCERGIEAGIICDSSTGGEFADTELGKLQQICCLGVHRLPMKRKPGLSDWRVIRELDRIFRDQSPQILHGHGAKGAAYARLLASRTGAKAVYTPHGGALHYSYATLRGVVYLGLERLLKGRTDGAVFESEFSRRSYVQNVGAAEFPHRVVHNGLYEHEFSRLANGSAEYDFVFVGELRNLKGIYVLADAAHQVRQQREFTLLAVGAGDEQSNLESRITELGLDGVVKVCPPIYPVTEALAKGRCIVIPSLAESLPYVVLETVAAAVPLLTTNVGGIPEIFGPFADRLLPAGDSRALAGAMHQFLDNPEGAQTAAEGIRAHVRSQFHVLRMVDAINTFYGEILHRDEPSAGSVSSDLE